MCMNEDGDVRQVVVIIRDVRMIHGRLPAFILLRMKLRVLLPPVCDILHDLHVRYLDILCPGNVVAENRSHDEIDCQIR